MNRKKYVAFVCQNQKQYHGEFHENTKVRLIKAYFRDISNINDFNLIYNNEYLIEEELSLRDIVNNSSKTNILFFIEEQKEYNPQEQMQVSNDKNFSEEKNNEVLLKQLKLAKNEIGNNKCVFFKSYNLNYIIIYTIRILIIIILIKLLVI
jgi:hypothetical protein